MFRRVIILGIVVVVSLMGLLIPMVQGKGTTTKHKRIAIVTPVTHPSLLKIESGFREQLAKSDMEIVTYNANGSPSLMHSELAQIQKENFDLVLTIGSGATKMAYEIFAKSEKSTPIVFAAVAHPELLGIDRESYPITGTVEVLNFREEIAALKQVKPDVERIVVIYDPSNHGLRSDVSTIQEIAKEQKIVVDQVEVFNAREIAQKAPYAIKKADAVLILKDNTLVAALPIVSELCKTHGKLLVTSDLDSFERGADVSVGVNEKNYGEEAGYLAVQILEEKKEPSEIAYHPVVDFTVFLRGEQ